MKSGPDEYATSILSHPLRPGYPEQASKRFEARETGEEKET